MSQCWYVCYVPKKWSSYIGENLNQDSIDIDMAYSYVLRVHQCFESMHRVSMTVLTAARIFALH